MLGRIDRALTLLDKATERKGKDSKQRLYKKVLRIGGRSDAENEVHEGKTGKKLKYDVHRKKH